MEGERCLNIFFYRKNIAKVINFFYRESVIPAILLVFRRSMDKNALKSVAIYGIPCYCTNLRVVSNYPGIIKTDLNNMRESVWPSTNKFKYIRTPARTFFFINYSNRTKHKEIIIRRYSSRLELNDLRFSRKFCRKTTIDVRSEVKSWIEKNSLLEKDM